jgi:hypothetical protein
MMTRRGGREESSTKGKDGCENAKLPLECTEKKAINK